MIGFAPATRKNLKARILLIGPTGSGKTFTALRLATALGKPVAVIDTEDRSASKYVGEVNPDGGRFAFQVCDLGANEREPESFIKAIDLAEKGGFGTLIIDSLSHAWAGVLAELDKRTGGKGDFSAWKTITPRHNALVARLTGCKLHLICSLRTKSEYVVEENDRGKKVPRRIGVAPVFRDGIEYDFDIALESHDNGSFTVTKTRASALFDQTFVKPGADVAEKILDWLNQGAPEEEPAASVAPPHADQPRTGDDLVELRDECRRLAAHFGNPRAIELFAGDTLADAAFYRKHIAALTAKIAEVEGALGSMAAPSAIDFSAREDAIGPEAVAEIRARLNLSATGPVPAAAESTYGAALKTALEEA